MSIIQPELEYVDRATETIRYLEHGWPTDLCRWHSHAEYELHLIVATQGKAFVGDYIGEFRPGSLFLIGPYLPHNWVTSESNKPSPVDIRDMLVQFSQNSLDQLSKAFLEFREIEAMFELAKSGIEFVGFSPTIAQQYFQQIRSKKGAERIVTFLRFLVQINAHAEKRPLSIVGMTQAEGSSKQARIAQVVDYISENYAKEISVEKASDMAGMSSVTFSRNFQRITGNKFIEFVNQVRISQACSMLYSTDDQIASIGFAVGFHNLANFNRQFMKRKQMTPKAYRELALSELTPAKRVAV